MIISKYILSAAVAVLSVQALATASHPNHTGFYLGLHSGYEIAKNKMKHNNSGKLRLVTINVDNKGSLNPKGFFGGAFLGYQQQLRCLIVGVEVSSSFFNSDKRRNFYDIVPGVGALGDNIQLKHKYNFGGSIKLGYLATPTVVAGIKIGYARDVYNIKTNNILYYVDDSVRLPIQAYNSSRNIKVNSFVPGIYVEKLINNHLLVGGEYNYSVSKNKKFKAGILDFGGGADAPSYQGSNRFKPSAHAVKIRLGYKF